MNVPLPFVIVFNLAVAIPLAAFWVISARRGPPTDFHVGTFALVFGLAGLVDAFLLWGALGSVAAVPALFGAGAASFGAFKLITWLRRDEVQLR
ncbi:MAG: hypothetical protein IAE78_22660 [Myxococcus sp.]|nr:hypothetical protein [Myxococcus sp.]